MKIAVVGHVEWTRFALVDHVAAAGEIVNTDESWCEASGGCGVPAVVLRRLTGDCLLFTAFGDDEFGHLAKKQLENYGVEVYASFDKSKSTNHSFCQIDQNNERSITVVGGLAPSGDDTSFPWEKLADMDAVYFASGDENALMFARRAKKLVSTARTLPVLKKAGLSIDALVMSEHDPKERYRTGDLTPEPELIIKTNGSFGGSANGKPYAAENVGADELKDSYGCGDSFAAGLALGLARDLSPEAALKVAIHEGAEAARRRGGFGTRT